MEQRENWTTQDASAAAAHGWELQEVWDQKKARVECAIFRTSDSPIKTDPMARVFVDKAASMGIEVARKAQRIVYASIVAGIKQTRRRK